MKLGAISKHHHKTKENTKKLKIKKHSKKKEKTSLLPKPKSTFKLAYSGTVRDYSLH